MKYLINLHIKNQQNIEEVDHLKNQCLLRIDLAHDLQQQLIFVIISMKTNQLDLYQRIELVILELLKTFYYELF